MNEDTCVFLQPWSSFINPLHEALVFSKKKILNLVDQIVLPFKEH